MVLVAPRHTVQEHFEERRDYWWRREGTRQIDSVYAAERFIEEVGFASCMTDSRRPGPSLYVAVCGRRDAVMPRNVQKDPESSQAWVLKTSCSGAATCITRSCRAARRPSSRRA